MWDLIVSVPDHCLSFYSTNVYTIMEVNKKCSLFPFKLSCLMQKIISTVKC